MRLDELESVGGNIGNPAASRVLQQQSRRRGCCAVEASVLPLWRLREGQDGRGRYGE